MGEGDHVIEASLGYKVRSPVKNTWGGEGRSPLDPAQAAREPALLKVSGTAARAVT